MPGLRRPGGADLGASSCRMRFQETVWWHVGHGGATSAALIVRRARHAQLVTYVPVDSTTWFVRVTMVTPAKNPVSRLRPSRVSDSALMPRIRKRPIEAG